jgi:hypothetical protein
MKTKHQDRPGVMIYILKDKEPGYYQDNGKINL